MTDFVLEKDPQRPYVLLYFPKDAAWEGTAEKVAVGIQTHLEASPEPLYVIVDIAESTPSMVNIAIAGNYHIFAKWMLHPNLREILLVTADSAVKAALAVMRRSVPDLRLSIFATRQQALANIGYEGA